mmetsp:Transcript_23835/g.37379  ORF Transcript_23835/g.37379 Transcript_23835/m.37379 type:complete len:421 (-) Transcript_23835:99-1361(-)
MIIITTAAIVFTLFAAVLLYACIIADPDTSNVGRFCTKELPSFLYQQLDKTVGKKVLSRLQTLMEHAFQLCYLTVVLGSWSIMFCYGYEEIEKSNYISTYHQYSGYVVFLMCMSSFHYACNTPPGSVTARTMPLFDHYQYDDVLYKNQICQTLKIRKIARSKYDRFTRRHVPRFDHFCGWINQAVGEQNYRWFLLFLTVHVLMCFYGSWAVFRILYGEVMDKDLFNASFFNAVTGAEVHADSWIVFHYLFLRHTQLCSIFVLMSVMSVVLCIFLAFHLYITAINMTTNEFFKWKSVRRWHKKEKQKYEQSLHYMDGASKKANSDSNKSSHVSGELSDVDVGCTGPRGELLRQSSASSMPDSEVMDPGDFPANIYNKGIIANFKEVFYPYSFRDEAMQRYKMSLLNQRESRKDSKGKPKTI